jgi:hypothetical protein
VKQTSQAALCHPASPSQSMCEFPLSLFPHALVPQSRIPQSLEHPSLAPALPPCCTKHPLYAPPIMPTIPPRPHPYPSTSPHGPTLIPSPSPNCPPHGPHWTPPVQPRAHSRVAVGPRSRPRAPLFPPTVCRARPLALPARSPTHEPCLHT